MAICWDHCNYKKEKKRRILIARKIKKRRNDVKNCTAPKEIAKVVKRESEG